jgi:putative oxidoreductase
MFMSKWCKTCPDTASLVLRIVVGVTFIMHGSQKCFGAFGGAGIDGVAGFLTQLGFPLPVLMAYVLSYGEFLAGVGVLLGAFTRCSAFFLSVIMAVAIFTVHLKNGFFASRGGIELPFILLGASLALFFTGCTKWGFDCTLLKKWCKKC